jgi:hypothetical protein
MRSQDVVRLFDAVSVGTRISVVNVPMSRIFRQLAVN